MFKRWFHKLAHLNWHSVIFKIALILLFMSVVTAIIGFMGYSQIGRMIEATNQVYLSNTQVIAPLSDVMQSMRTMEHFAVDGMLYNKSSSTSGFLSNFNNLSGLFSSLKYNLPEKTYGELENTWNEFNPLARDVYDNLSNHTLTAEKFGVFLKSSNEIYSKLYALSISYRDKGMTAFSTSKKQAEGVVQFQVLVTVLGVVIAVLIGVLVALSIVGPLQKLQKSTDLLAQGDLQVQVNVKSKDEVGAVGNAFNRAVLQLRSMVTDASEYAKKINESGDNLFSVTNETSRSLGDLNRLVEDLARGATEQSTTVLTALKTVQKAVAESQLVTQKTFSINDSCKECSVAAERGKEASTDISGIIQNIVGRVQEIHSMVFHLAEDLRQIQDLVKAISDISEKTKLLSLNASIEAARAGEQGRGFAVVASNIRQLALQAQESAEHINDVIGNIFIKTDQVVATVEMGTHEAEKGSQTLNETVAIFQELVQQVSQITGEIGEITSIVSEMGQGNQAVIREMDKVAQISENNMAAVEEVSATFEEQYASTVVVTEAAKDLQSLASKLASVAEGFKI